MRRILLYAGIMLGLTACANHSTIITGAAMPEIDYQQVRIFYPGPVDCQFEQVALIHIPGEYFNRAALINAFREKAASVGATAVVVTDLQQLGSAEYRGSAKAIRCL